MTDPADSFVSIGDDGLLNHKLRPDLSRAWIDRDLSWLDFNRRVLAEAEDSRTPLLERLKFLAIFSSNLDEFFMKRIAVLREELTPERLDVLAGVREHLMPALEHRADCFETVIRELDERGVALRRWEELTEAQKLEADLHFDANVWPAMTPLVVDPAHPFPFLANLSTSLAFVIRESDNAREIYARVKIPAALKQWTELHDGVPSDQRVFVRLREVVKENAAKLYPGMTITRTTEFRLTRDAEVALGEDAHLSLKELVREQVRQRRFEPVVRLEFGPGADQDLREMLRSRCRSSR